MNSPRTEITVLILVDALRHDYVTAEDAPFLYELARTGIYGSLIPTFGFEPDAAHFAGLFPDESNSGAHYWYDPTHSPFGFTGSRLAWLDAFPELPRLVGRKLLQWVVQKSSRYALLRSQASTARIPFRYLHYFDYSQKQLPFEPGYAPRKTIFDFLKEDGKNWFFHASPLYRVNSRAVLERVRAELKPPCAFAYLHIGDLDTIGHKFGPDSIERKDAVRHVDDCLREIHNDVDERFDIVHWILFGDHGMVEVKHILDVWSVLKNTEFRFGRDYIFFLDSTMVRFWFFEERAKSHVTSVLKKLQGANILDQSDLDHYHLNYSHNRFGDLLFLAEPRVLILPNFYQEKAIVKGMHGYAPEFPDHQAAVLINSPHVLLPRRLDSPVDMRKIFPTVLKLLDLKAPITCQLQSIV